MTTTKSTETCPFDAALSEEAPKWGHENDSLRAGLALARNRVDLDLAAACLCAPEDDARHHVTCLCADLGQSDAAARDYRRIGLMLERMPKLTKVLTVRGFAPLSLLKKLSSATQPVSEERCPELEPLLLEALLPGVDKLAMRTWKDLFPAIQRAIDTVEHSARPQDLNGPPPPNDVEETFSRRKSQGADKAHRIALNLAPAHAEEAHRVISTIAATQECDGAEAFMHLVRGTAEASVSLHLYRSIDGGPVWMPGVGVLSEALTEEYLSMVTSVDTLTPSAASGYAATDGQRAFIMGRDGTCMFPGCSRSPAGADMDHITNHADGGPTSTDNLHALCRRHHNEKTKGLWDVTRSLSGTEYWTSASSGVQVATEPTGPLSHPGAVPFAASIRKAKALRAEHNEHRDDVRARYRDGVAQARNVQPVVRMLQQIRVMGEDESSTDFINSITKHAAQVAVEADEQRARDRHERQRIKLARFRAQVEGIGPIKDPDPPTVEPADSVGEMLQVYLNERNPVTALTAIGRLLAKIDPGAIKEWQHSFADPSPLRQRIAECQLTGFRQKVRRIRRKNKPT